MKQVKHQRKNKKQRAVGKQGCCGLFACLYAVGIHLKTAQDVETYRQLCKEKKLVSAKTASWMGGTRDGERRTILQHFGARFEEVGTTAKTLRKLLMDKNIYQTKATYIVTVTGHCLYLKTNMMKRKLFLVDQRGVHMPRESPLLARFAGRKVCGVLRVHT